MANQFNIDKGGTTVSDTHLLNETFHVFSKSPSQPGVSLGGARLKSGHTTTSSDVWSQEIPAFFNAATQEKFDLFQGLASKDDLCLFGGNIYIHDGSAFVSKGAADTFLSDGKVLQKNGKDVIKYHKDHTAINLTAENNNGDGGNDCTAKIYNAATGSTTFVSQFISPTDKFVGGVPSSGYDAVVKDSTGQLAEGLTADNDYICNAYAGVIQFNTAREQGSVTVSAWEYIGEKLNTTLSNIEGQISSAVAGAVTSISKTNDCGAAITLGGSYETDTPNIKYGAVTIKLDTAKATGADYVNSTAVAEKGYVDEQIAKLSAEDGAIQEAIADATLASDTKIADITTTEDEGKLVTASQVTTYVSENAKVSVSADNSAPAEAVTSIKVAGDATGADVTIATSKDTNAEDGSATITVSATLNKATVNSGVIDTSAGNGDKVVSATNVKAIADKSASDAVNAIAATGTWGTESLNNQYIKVEVDMDATNKLVVSANDIASAADLSALDTKVTNHIADAAKLSIIVASGTGEDNHPDIAEPSTNKIYLVPDTNAESGSYIEWIYVEKADNTKGWESIGSTKTDLSDYATTDYADQAETDAVNTAKTYTNEQIAALSAAGGAIKALDTRVTTAEGEIDDLQSAVTTLQGADTVAGSVAEAKKAGTDAQAAVDALEALVGETDVATQITNAINELDAINIGTGAVKVTQENGKVISVTTETAAITSGSNLVGSVSSETALVTAQEALAADKIVKAIADAKISSVETDTDYFGSALVTTDGTDVTIHPAKEWEIGDKKPIGSITSVIDGKASDGSIIDIANLTNGTNMFAGNVNLTTFVGDMSKLTNGTGMFNGCSSLATFCGDLSSLTDGTDMFKGCVLDIDSVMFIVDSLPVLAEGVTRKITIGVNKTLVTTEALAAINTALGGTGWEVIEG